MIKREKYLSEIRAFYDSDLIKALTGVRRCGKSTILEQVIDEISAQGKQCIYLDFDDRAATRRIQKWEDIVDYVNAQRQTKELCYVFLDEIQTIDGWQLACRSLRRENCSVFITGSNSKLLSAEFTKELSGRYVSFRIYPFVYRELKEYAQELGKTISITDYLIWGGFPKRIEFSSESSMRDYLNDLDETIVINDIVNRYHIRKTDLFERVADYILISNARTYSANSISSYLKSQGIHCSANTIQKWIEYMKNAYVIDGIREYSRKAKRELTNCRKIYNCDVALNSIRVFDGHYDLTHNLENIVFNELRYMGYQLSDYDNNGREIDFLAQKDNLKYYVQAAYSVLDPKAYKREFSAFEGISQNDRKIIITNDDLDYSTSNVQHIKLKDFLEMKSLQG